jgi:hypothetical protein
VVFLVYIRDGISNRDTKILTSMKEIIWLGVKKKRNSQVEIFMGFVYNSPQSSQ